MYYDKFMLIPGESFPYKALEAQDKRWVLANCGGEPVTSPKLLRNFLVFSGLPLLQQARSSVYVDSLALRSVRSLEIDVDPFAGKVAFNRGGLFYAGVLNVATQAKVLPVDAEVIRRVTDADGQNFALDSYQIIREEVPTFCELVKEISPAMQIEDERMHQLALVGAGALHTIVKDSLEKIASASADDLFAAHPELMDLGNSEQL